MSQEKIKPKAGFNKNILTLLTGTTIAQAIPIALSPILTRIYTPEDFGVLSVFVSISLIFGSIAAGRYEMAIMLPDEDEDALNLAALGSLLSAGLFIILLLTVFLLGDSLMLWLDIAELEGWIYLIPLVVFFIGIFNVLKYYNNRLEKYKDISKASAYKALATGIVQLGLGIFVPGAFGLLMGQLVSYVVSNTKLAVNTVRDFKNNKVSIQKIKLLGARYIDFPKFSLSAILANQLSYNLLNILVSSLYSTSILGFFSLVNRLLGMPTTLVGNAVGQVFFKEAVKEKSETGTSSVIFKTTTIRLFLVSIVPFVLLFLFSKDIFEFVFGEEWGTAGAYAKTLIPMFFVRFITAPLSTITIVYEKQKIFLVWQIVLLILTVGTILIANYIGLNFTDFLLILSISGSFHYLLLFMLTYSISSGVKV